MATTKNTGLEIEVSNALMALIPDAGVRGELGQELADLCGKFKQGADIATRANDMLHRMARAWNLRRGIDAGTTARLPGSRKAHVVTHLGAFLAQGMTPREAIEAEISAIGAPIEGLNDGVTSTRGVARYSSRDVFGE